MDLDPDGTAKGDMPYFLGDKLSVDGGFKSLCDGSGCRRSGSLFTFGRVHVLVDGTAKQNMTTDLYAIDTLHMYIRC